MKLINYRPANSFDQPSLRDLLDAREQYHIHLMQHPNVVATAVGRYRIRKRDSLPTKTGSSKIHGTYPRDLANSEVRYYSWPSILVFVDKWEDAAKLEKTPGGLVPNYKTLYLPDGRSVPVCVIWREQRNTMKLNRSRSTIRSITLAVGPRLLLMCKAGNMRRQSPVSLAMAIPYTLLLIAMSLARPVNWSIRGSAETLTGLASAPKSSSRACPLRLCTLVGLDAMSTSTLT
jgi:hypothetical protein